jgi:hypothetical protein
VIVQLANLRTAIEAPAHSAASEDAYVGIASELHDDAGASRQLSSTVPENGIQLVPFANTRLGFDSGC